MEQNQGKVIQFQNNIDYFKIQAVSSSSLNRLNPEEGGSPKKFAEFLLGEDQEERKESVHMERGSLIHNYIENPDSFGILEIDKPSDKLGEVADLCIAKIKDVIDIVELTDESLKNTLLVSCRELEWNSRYGDDAIIKNASPILPYVIQMVKLEEENKTPMTKTTRQIVVNCIESIKKHKVANELLFGVKNDTIEIFKEKAILWTETVNGFDIPCKGKIDNFELDYINQTIIITDLKTGAFNIGNFSSTFKYRRIYRQLAFYVKAVYEFCKQKDINVLDWKIELRIIAVETKDEFRTGVFKVPQSWYYKGKNEYESLLERYAFHLKNGFEYSVEEYLNNGYLTLNEPEN